MVIDVKEQTWLTNLKYLRLSTEYFMGIIYMCTMSKVNGIYTENKICLSNKEYIGSH